MNPGLPAGNKEIADLKNQLKVTPVRGTDFIGITVKHPSQKQAALIANAVAEAYLIRRTEIETHRADRALEILGEEINGQVQIVGEQKIEFVQTCKTFGLNDPFLKDELPNLEELGKALHLWNEQENPKATIPCDPGLARQNFQEAKSAYLQSRDMLTEMISRHQETRLLFRTPKRSVTIYERAR